MLKKLPFLLVMCALCMWAADFWTAKPFTDWNEKEIVKMLSDSPWTGKVTVSGGVAAFAGPSGGGGGDFGGGGGGGISVTLLWQTALPVKQALVKRQFGAEAGTSPDAKARLERPDQVYVLTLLGMPAFTLGAAQGDKKAALLDATMLTAGGKPPLKPVDVQVSGGRGPGNVSFLFPRTTTFTADDKDVEFSTKFDKTTIKHKFKLKDMVFNGKVEM